jgi:hypothetical protein
MYWNFVAIEGVIKNQFTNLISIKVKDNDIKVTLQVTVVTPPLFFCFVCFFRFSLIEQKYIFKPSAGGRDKREQTIYLELSG